MATRVLELELPEEVIKIESGPETAEEMQQEIDAMRRFVGRS